MWLLLLTPHPLIGPFIFEDLVYLCQLVDSGQVLCAGLIVALHLDNSTSKAYLCNQGGTVSPFVSRLACQILASMVLLLFQHTFLTTSMWRLIICPRIRCFRSGIFFLRWHRQLFNFGAFQMWTYWHLLIQLNASIITDWNLHYLGGPWG